MISSRNSHLNRLLQAILALRQPKVLTCLPAWLLAQNISRKSSLLSPIMNLHNFVWRRPVAGEKVHIEAQMAARIAARVTQRVEEAMQSSEVQKAIEQQLIEQRAELEKTVRRNTHDFPADFMTFSLDLWNVSLVMLLTDFWIVVIRGRAESILDWLNKKCVMSLCLYLQHKQKHFALAMDRFSQHIRSRRMSQDSTRHADHPSGCTQFSPMNARSERALCCKLAK